MVKSPRLLSPTRRECVAGLVALPAMATSVLSDAGKRTILDQTGRTVTLPQPPKRVVSLSDITFTIALHELGVPVVASTRVEDEVHGFHELFGVTAQEAGITDLGPLNGFDVEIIAALKPDLIVADEDFNNLGGLSLIAPVYTGNYFAGTEDVLGLPPRTADALGVGENHDALKANYEARIASMRARLGTDRRNLTWLAAMVSSADFLLGHSKGAFSHVARDLGFSVPQWVEDITPKLAFTPLSIEELPRVDADLVMFMPPYYVKDASPKIVKDAMEALLPGWESFVPAARNDAIVYVSGETAIVPAFTAAHRMLDAIEAQWHPKNKDR